MTTIEFDHVRYGSTETCVKAFQKALIAAGYKIPSGATGKYGDETKSACAKFQRAQGWSGSGADGLPGKETFTRLGLKDGGHGSGGRVSSPVPGHKVGTPYGQRGSWQAGYHTGDDYPAPTGTPVVAVRAGTIAWSNGDGKSYGNWICLRADNGRDYVYCHLSQRAVAKGDKVKAGDRLGKVGATGNVTGPHLHFEDRPRGGGYGNDRKPSW
ncbi:peptidoglycan DD-metalloendopeptidase family protein [Streptomyces sp. KM273126]|uniref:peptidoglycan DD-metalloendopeptidase family protein n=1 Tax=Streptomyces sp. KM273126 TaxID=2545247 RepID=UPI0010401B20|nr:peptidoglycan DD-metalloendopeptidase family protein [Streptomyces sp. KM273126]MBA2806970.1 peptidoglycan DD-metalloendopeptidase family protein [Streptomyces sp. KM273126]